jgi:hypothetical protein
MGFLGNPAQGLKRRRARHAFGIRWLDHQSITNDERKVIGGMVEAVVDKALATSIA